MKPKKKVNILIIEDNRLLREGLTSMINEQPDLKVIGAYSEKDKSVDAICAMKPDLVLIDLGLRSKNSLEIVKCMKEKSPEIKIVVMDLMPLEDDILDFVKAGAEGFILKDAKVNEFLKTISSVAEGKKVLPSNLTGTLFTEIIERAMHTSKSSEIKKAFVMTKREKQVIGFIADGLSNKEIGHMLHLSPFTIKSHVHNILEKMALHTRVQIATYAHTSGDYKKP